MCFFLSFWKIIPKMKNYLMSKDMFIDKYLATNWCIRTAFFSLHAHSTQQIYYYWYGKIVTVDGNRIHTRISIGDKIYNKRDQHWADCGSRGRDLNTVDKKNNICKKKIGRNEKVQTKQYLRGHISISLNRFFFLCYSVVQLNDDLSIWPNQMRRIDWCVTPCNSTMYVPCSISMTTYAEIYIYYMCVSTSILSQWVPNEINSTIRWREHNKNSSNKYIEAGAFIVWVEEKGFSNNFYVCLLYAVLNMELNEFFFIL